MFKNKYKIPLLEVVLDILHPVHPLLDLQVDLSIMNMVPNDITCQKTLGFDAKTKFVACSMPKFQFHPLKLSLASYSPSTLFLAHMTICGF